jgi:hypothetical protein
MIVLMVKKEICGEPMLEKESMTAENSARDK